MSTERPDDTDLFRQRVAAFGLWIGAIGGGGLAIRAGAHVALGNSLDTFVSVAWGAHLGAVACLLALFAIVRRPGVSIDLVRWLEPIGLWSASICYQLVGLHLLPEARPDYVVLLAMNVMFVGRAAFVPSTPARTAWITGLIGIPMLVLTYFDLRNAPDHPSIPAHAPETRTLNAAVWWTIVTLLAVLITRTIYGLRRQVERAQRLGQYQLEELLAAGGMGEVYRARHAMLRRPTAIKLIRPEVVGERSVARFEREAKLTASLSHPNTVTIYDYGRTEEGIFYYAMELLDGADLQTVIDHTGPMPPARACRLLAQVAGALAEAHEAGLIHRDVKPGNILLVRRGSDDDVAKVVDFGLVKERDEESPLTVTDDDRILGTPLYVSPESIVKKGTVDARSDVYALGAVAYFLLSGRPPFEGDSAIEVYMQHVQERPPPIAAPVPIEPSLERLILQCLEKLPEDRPQSAREVEVRLLDVLERLPPWERLDVRRWWQTHGPTLRTAQQTQARRTPPRMAVTRAASDLSP